MVEKSFKSLIELDKKFSPASIWDPLSARMADRLGIEMLMLAGSVASEAHLGMTDDILLTATELSDLVTRITARSSRPLIVDADHGYGVARNTARTADLLARAGAAAITIEDTVLPRPDLATGKSALVPAEEGLRRVEAAVTVGRRTGLAIIGRTSAMQISGAGETVDRLLSYAEAGCDMLMPVGSCPVELLAELGRRSGLPLMLSTLPPRITSEAELVSLGVRIVLAGHHPCEAAYRAGFEAYASQAGRQEAWSKDEMKRLLSG
ncbi:isocitrate lyase/PEP mutase family protein [Nitratireductor indicus]|uniref:isocitrate lyase/PEP mutase family protein n=1 Tax=Nitratireductor indicus TaxID=721133 RepID=UPI002874A24E|nr:isocitrate lyase/PEP mutase family protein [Nitratireductor indicus]MDS1138767.1 isocitrate lyase/PEP mutase family protein [Nitratireductor indicus]